MEYKTPEYDAFISYRHLPREQKIAKHLQKLLERYSLPKSMQQPGTACRLRVFRDETDFSASGNLTKAIQTALENARFLIFICSPESADSIWCQAELSYFKKIHGGSTKNILVLVIDDEVPKVFPEILRWENIEPSPGEQVQDAPRKRSVEPFAIALPAGDVGRALRKLDAEFLRFAATLWGCSYDTLRNRAQIRKMKQFFVAAVLIMSLLGGFAVYNWNVSQQMKQQNELLEIANLSLEESNYNLRVKNADILAAAAETALDNNDREAAITSAIEALPTSESDDLEASALAEYVLSQASLAYTYETTWLYEAKTTTGLLEGIFVAEDAQTVLYYDDIDNVIILDTATNQTKTIAFAQDETIQNSTIWAVQLAGDKAYLCFYYNFVCISLTSGEILWNVEIDAVCDDLFYFSASNCSIVADDANGWVAFVSSNGALVLDDTASLVASFAVEQLDTPGTDYIIQPHLTTLSQQGEFCLLAYDRDDDVAYQRVLLAPSTQTIQTAGFAQARYLSAAYLVDDVLYVYADAQVASITAFDLYTMTQNWYTEFEQGDLAYNWSSNLYLTYLAGQTVFLSGEQVPVVYALTRYHFAVLNAQTGAVIASYAYDSVAYADAVLLDASSGIWVLADPYVCVFPFSDYIGMYIVNTLKEQSNLGVFVSDGLFVLGAENSNQLNLYQMYTPNQENALACITGEILQISDDGVIAYQTSAGEIIVYQPLLDLQLAAFVPDITVDAVAFLVEDTYLVADDAGVVQAYSSDQSLPVTLDLAQDGKYLYDAHLYANQESNSFLYENNGNLFFCALEENSLCVQQTVSYEKGYLAVNDAATEALVLQQDTDGYGLYLYNIATATAQKIELPEITQTPACILALAISADGNIVTLVHSDGFLLVYDIEEKSAQIFDWDVTTNLPKAISISPTAQMAIVLCTNNNVIAYSFAQGQMSDTLATIPSIWSDSFAVAYLSSELAAIYTNYAQYTVYDLDTLQPTAQIQGFLQYLPQENCYLASEYLSSNSGQLYAYPYYTTQILIAHGQQFLAVLESFFP